MFLKVLQCNSRRSSDVLLAFFGLLYELDISVHIVLISEPPKQFYIPNFRTFRKDINSKCAILVSTQILNDSCYVPNDSDYITLMYYKNILISCFYIPPNFNNFNSLSFFDCLDKVNIDNLIIGGDSNGASPLWCPDYVVTTREQRLRGEWLTYHLTCRNCTCECCGDTPTFCNKSILSRNRNEGKAFIDVTFSSGNVVCSGWHVLETDGLWDHYPIFYNIEYNGDVPLALGQEHDLCDYQYYSCDWTRYYDILRNNEYLLLKDDITNIRDLRHRYDSLVKLIQEAFKSSCPPRPSGTHASARNGRILPWWDDELCNLRKKMKRLHRQGRHEEYRHCRNEYRKSINTKKHNAFCSYLSGISDLQDRQLYKKIKRTPSPPCRIFEGDYDLDSSLNRLASTYVGAEDLDYDAFFNMISENDVRFGRDALDMDFSPFTKEEFTKVIKMRSAAKDEMPGRDGIRLQFLLNLPDGYVKELLRVISFSVMSGCVLPAWRFSEVVFINKNGKDPRSLKSVPPISLTNTLGKVAEFLILDRLTVVGKQFYEEGIQFGFVKGRGTIGVVQNIISWITSNVRWAVLSTDYSNAFGEILHTDILKYLEKAGVHDYIINWVKSWLSDRGARVRYGGRTVFKKAAPNKGCPQGGGLSPLLFISGSDGIPKRVNERLKGNLKSVKWKWICYADDCYLLLAWPAGVLAEQIAADIELAYQIIKEEAQVSNLSLERSKCHIMSNIRSLDRCGINGLVKELNVLGVILTPRLGFLPHLRHRVMLALQLNSAVLRYIKQEVGLTPFRCLQVYEKIFIPRVSYGIEVYGASLCMAYLRDFIDTAANTFLRGALRLRRSTPLDYVYTLSGYPPLSDILLGKAITIHYHKASFNDMIGKRAVVKRAKIDKILATFGFPSDYCGDKLGTDPYMTRELASRIVIGDDKVSSLEMERQVLTPWKAYTDGSMIRHKTKTVLSVGAAFFIKKEDGTSHFEGKRLSTNVSIMHAELMAICLCLKWIVDNLTACEISLFSDSKSGLQLLQSCRTSDLLNQIRDLDTMCSALGVKLFYYWIAGHSGSEGNEKVDVLANQARSLPHITKLSSSISYTKEFILDYFERSKHERLRRLSGDTAEALATPFQLNNLLKVVHHRSDGGPLCRLLVGHTIALNSYKYRSGHRSYLCDTCMRLDNLRHAVFFCDAESRANLRPGWIEPFGSFRQLTVNEFRVKDMIKYASHLEKSACV